MIYLNKSVWGLGNNSSPYFLYEYLLRKRAPKGSPDVHFTNNAQMVYAHPALIRSSGSGLSAFCPTLFCLSMIILGLQVTLYEKG